MTRLGSTKVSSSETLPSAKLIYLDTLWFQITGTLCNLRCTHCFIACSPENHRLEMMETDQVLSYLEQAQKLGVKEIYYTGGEPFIHKDFLFILAITLRNFPATVLTNGLLINDRRADQLQQLSRTSRYSLELRISLDDYEEQGNDAVRGKGNFNKVLQTYQRLYQRGFLPILAVTEIRDHLNSEGKPSRGYQEYVCLLESIGIDRPRIKIIPIFEMGGLPNPAAPQYVTSEMMDNFDHRSLQCSTSRMVAHNGVYACPILVGEEKARLAKSSLKETFKPCALYHTACHTCHVTSMTCKNY